MRRQTAGSGHFTGVLHRQENGSRQTREGHGSESCGSLLCWRWLGGDTGSLAGLSGARPSCAQEPRSRPSSCGSLCLHRRPTGRLCRFGGNVCLGSANALLGSVRHLSRRLQFPTVCSLLVVGRTHKKASYRHLTPCHTDSGSMHRRIWRRVA
jgi:hypothetical protein